MTGCDKNSVHLPQTSGFDQWTSRSSTLLVLWTSKSSENTFKQKGAFNMFQGHVKYTARFLQA